MSVCPEIDIAPGVYNYCRQWWGLKATLLTRTKCEILRRSITEWRSAYWKGKLSKLRSMYRSDRDLLGYLAAFAPRYAYIPYFLMKATGKDLNVCASGDHLAVCLLGGGSGVEMIGLLAYLAERKTVPRDVEIHFIDRSPQWRRFHAFLFASLMPHYFPKTRVLPYYHDLDLSNPGLRYDTALSRALDARIFLISNLLSEVENQTGIRENLRVLLRSTRKTFFLLVADSNAKKLRPRLSWIDQFLTDLGFKHWLYLSDSFTVDCSWLKRDPTSDAIFGPPGPSFLTSVRRYGFVAKVKADGRGERVP